MGGGGGVDAKYMRRGAEMAVRQDPGGRKELEKMNKSKNGRPYEYTESLIRSIMAVKLMCGLSTGRSQA